MDKKTYVDNYLSPAMVAAGTGITKVEYKKNERMYQDTTPPFATHYNEELVVWYNEYYYKTVNIGGDSPSGMFYDVVKQGIF